MESPFISYKQIKWLILLIPTLTVGLWEYIRHTPPMLKRLSMETGNWLTPVIVLGVTLLFVRKLFKLMEEMQRKLEKEKAMKIMLQEREKIARQLHDGIAQSIFLLSVKLTQWEMKDSQLGEREEYQKLRKTVQHIHDDVRQSIFNLRNPVSLSPFPWTESLQHLVINFRKETGCDVKFHWNIPEELLSAKEKIELYACLKEVLMNVHKHAQANQVLFSGEVSATGWVCKVADNGVGFKEEELAHNGGYGLQIVQDRVQEMGWEIKWESSEGETKVEIRKE